MVVFVAEDRHEEGTSMKVVKFGGTSLADARQILKVVDIVK
jgi:aspartokinase